MSSSATHARLSDRLAAGVVLVILAVGCLCLWIGVPAAGLWLAARITADLGPHLVIALVLIIAGMCGMAMALVWVNGLYLRITGGEMQPIGEGVSIRRHGPLEPLLLVCLVLAGGALLFWFFVIADNPTVNVY